MLSIVPRHRAVVLSLFECRGNRSEALRRNGYCKNAPDRNLNAQASRFFSDPKIKRAIRETADSYIDSSEAGVVMAVEQIMHSEGNKPADRLRAAEMMWSRSNPIVSKHEVAVEHSFERRHDAALEDLRILKNLGVPREKLIESFGYSGLPMLEKLLAERDGVKLIEAQATEAVVVEQPASREAR
jgi:hypothetical protein